MEGDAPSHSELSPSTEALILAIHLASVASLKDSGCYEHFGSSRKRLLTVFRRGVEHALARSNIMATEDMTALQAFVVFITVLRSTDPMQSWALSGLAFRLLQLVGMHRDGTVLGLGVFETEMRRRLWWGLSTLDVPASENHSCSSSV
jgi:hypothetical protein